MTTIIRQRHRDTYRDMYNMKGFSPQTLLRIYLWYNYNDFFHFTETDGENSDDSMPQNNSNTNNSNSNTSICYACVDEENMDQKSLITPCECIGDTRYVHVECLCKWYTTEADKQVCLLPSFNTTYFVCKSTFCSDFKVKDRHHIKLFKYSLDPPYVSLHITTK